MLGRVKLSWVKDIQHEPHHSIAGWLHSVDGRINLTLGRHWRRVIVSTIYFEIMLAGELCAWMWIPCRDTSTMRGCTLHAWMWILCIECFQELHESADITAMSLNELWRLRDNMQQYTC